MQRSLEEFLAYLSRLGEKDGIRIALVGGAVRDVLLGRDSFDVDVVVEADAVEFADRHFPDRKKRVFKYYRTCSVWFEEVGRVDFATARKEHYPQCASRPVISPATIEEDLFRRDFTINAMAWVLAGGVLDPSGPIDLYGGKKDLEDGILDVLHERSFCDDPIRILRGIRYCVRFDFRFSDRCLRLIEEARQKRYLELVPKERVVDEIGLIRKEPDPDRVFSMIRDLGLELPVG